MTRLAALELNRTDWSQWSVAAGSSVAVRDSLDRLLDAGSPDDVERLHWELENVVFSQDHVYAVAVPCVSVMVAALADSLPFWVRAEVLGDLYLILAGWDAPDRPERGVVEECRRRAAEGYWLIAREAVTGLREPAVAVLRLISDDERTAAIAATALQQDRS